MQSFELVNALSAVVGAVAAVVSAAVSVLTLSAQSKQSAQDPEPSGPEEIPSEEYLPGRRMASLKTLRPAPC
ncbi:hypothetical protein K378_02940 [Streptomyces sp. Amel2xB2]|uniref:hypothetical protein n=1 Tax=Streptomyces sp. Amel2xB2 TaxID=1305829 RepID=UPI000DBAC06E|nr:hypothetical protein [Streptomyces sp. Amel2xB2]RAJ66765.1 hypothetical protein K378_02940 [Streptomyces sp. Amel2xB2]